MSYGPKPLRCGRFRVGNRAYNPHRVPLSSAAVVVLERSRRLRGAGGLVFPGRGGKAIGKAVFGRLLKDLGIECSRHGFRSSFRSWCSDEGIDRELAEQALAHAVGSQVEQCYARTTCWSAGGTSWSRGRRSWPNRTPAANGPSEAASSPAPFSGLPAGINSAGSDPAPDVQRSVQRECVSRPNGVRPGGGSLPARPDPARSGGSSFDSERNHRREKGIAAPRRGTGSGKVMERRGCVSVPS